MFLVYVHNLEINEHQFNDNSHINKTNIQINKINDKNYNESNNSNVNDSNKQYYVNFNKKIHDDKKTEFNNSSDDALIAKIMIEKYALSKNEVAKYPIYKNKRLNAWLVPIFDKNTGKFKGSIYATSDAHFVMGPQFYSEYKELVYGKKTKQNHISINKTKKDKKINNKTKTNLFTKNIKISKSLDNLNISSNSYQPQSIELDVGMNVSR